MSQTLKNLRQNLKKIAPLYRLVGFVRLAQFKRELKRAQFEYDRMNASDIPPPKLRYRVHRALDLRSYETLGNEVSDAIVATIKRINIETDGKDILDFASGPGRAAKWLKKKLPGINLTGSDIDREAIEWASTNLPHVGAFVVNDYRAPTEFSEEQFDLIYSISLFTHLDEKLQDEWLKELHRILKKGGYLLATTHGQFAQSTCTDAECTQLAVKGFVFRQDHSGMLKLDGLPDFYQTAFHTVEYVSRHWGQWFEIVEHIEGGISGHQDLVVMRRA